VIALLGKPIHAPVKKVDEQEFEPVVGRESPA
jgi:hypothetical protein